MKNISEVNQSGSVSTPSSGPLRSPDDVNLPPPPPNDFERDDDDDLPLPPPPDLDTMPAPPPSYSTPVPSIASIGSNDLLMRNLSVKLAARNVSSAAGAVSKGAPPPVATKSFRRQPGTSSVMLENVPPGGPGGSALPPPARRGSLDAGDMAGDENSLLSQIQRGMSLRRTACNDRSAPRVIKN